MTLLLDGQKVNGKSLKVTANLRIESSDMSGQTSNTDRSHQGFKPKVLTVSLTIPYRDRVHLADIMRLAETTAGGGQPKVYRLVNDTAEAFGVRQVQFSDTLSAKEDDNLSAWRVQFTLTEKLSNPERVETRRPNSRVNRQAGTGTRVTDPTVIPPPETDATVPELSGFESILKRVDEYLEPAP